jgi:hypothetical protein
MENPATHCATALSTVYSSFTAFTRTGNTSAFSVEVGVFFHLVMTM